MTREELIKLNTPKEKGYVVKLSDNMKDNLRRFDDGYQFGDLSKTYAENVGEGGKNLVTTGGELVGRVAQGVMSVPENLARLGATGVAKVADWAGKDEFANALRKTIAEKDIYTGGLRRMNEALDKNSFTGTLIDASAEGVGHALAQSAINSVIPANIPVGKLNMPLTAVLSGAGGATKEAYSKTDFNNYGTKEKLQNATKIIGGGVVEGISEGLFGLLGVGGNDITDEWAKRAVERAKTGFGKIATNTLIKGGGEAIEELISYAGNYMLENGVVDKMGNIDYSKNWDWKELGTDMLSAFISSGAIGAGTSIRALKSGNMESQTNVKPKENTLDKNYLSDLKINEIEREYNKKEYQINNTLEELENIKANKQNYGMSSRYVSKYIYPQIQALKNGFNSVTDYKMSLANKAAHQRMVADQTEYATKPKEISQEVFNDAEESINSLVNNHNSIELGNIQNKVYELIKDMYTEEELSNMDPDIFIEQEDKVIEFIKNKLIEKNYKYDRELSTYEPDMTKIEATDDINFTYNERAKNGYQREQLDVIREKARKIVSDMQLPDGVEITYDESKASSDATYISVYDEKTDKVYEIRIGNHFKQGRSGRANEHISISDYSSIEELETDIKNAINNGVKSVSNTTQNSTELEKTREPEQIKIINTLNTNQNMLPSNAELQKVDNDKISSDVETLNAPTKKVKLEDVVNMTEKDAQLPNATYKAQSDKGTNYTSKFYDNVQSSKIIDPKVKDSIEDTSYIRQTNAEALEKVTAKLEEDPNGVANKWFAKEVKDFKDEDIALGAVLITKYQEEGKYEQAISVTNKLRDSAKYQGRAVQMFSIFQRLTPEGMAMYQTKKLESLFDEVSKKKTGEWVEANKDKYKLTEEDAKFIHDKVIESQQATDERGKQIPLAEIESRINNKVPAEAGQALKTWRRIAMLFNPKTQVRNVVGNANVLPLNYVADFVGAQIDKAIAKKTGVRTTNAMDLKAMGKGFKKGFVETFDDYKRGIRTTPSGSKFEITPNSKSFNENTKSAVLNAVNKKLNNIDNLLSTVLEAGDRPFYEAMFNSSLQGQMKANNVTEPTQEMIDIASNEALQRTWNDSNKYTEAVLSVRKAMNKINVNGFGLGDLIIPFAKTPANLTKAMVEYSPAGVINSLISYNDMAKAISRGEMTAQQQKNFVNSTSKAIAGTMLYAIVGALVQSGAITGSADDDKDVADFEKNVLGIQPYSIKIGDKSFTYNWAQPLSAPFAIMADTYKMSKENQKASEILANAFKVAGDQLVENSFLQGIKELFSAESLSEGLVDALASLPNQFVPTLFGQTATVFDDTKRQTFEYKNKLGTIANEVKSKTPGAKSTLAPQVNTFGEEIKNYGGDNNLFNIFLNPANVSSNDAMKSQVELYNLYQETGDKGIFPRKAPYYIGAGENKQNLSSQDRVEYQKTSGKYASSTIRDLFYNKNFKNLSNDAKVEILQQVVSDADTTAKDIWIDNEATKKLADRNKKLVGMPLADYYLAYYVQKEAEGVKNAQGKTISGSKKKNQIKAINDVVKGTKDRELLYSIFNLD